LSRNCVCSPAEMVQATATASVGTEEHRPPTGTANAGGYSFGLGHTVRTSFLRRHGSTRSHRTRWRNGATRDCTKPATLSNQPSFATNPAKLEELVSRVHAEHGLALLRPRSILRSSMSDALRKAGSASHYFDGYDVLHVPRASGAEYLIRVTKAVLRSLLRPAEIGRTRR
jgi:hypothetical protein